MKTWTQEEEAERLRARFAMIRQAKFARDHKVPGGPSMLSQHIHGRRPISLEHGRIYAKAFGVSLHEISPRLALEAQKLGIPLEAPLQAMEPVVGYSLEPQNTRKGLADTLADLAGHLKALDDITRGPVASLLTDMAKNPSEAESIVAMICVMVAARQKQSAA